MKFLVLAALFLAGASAQIVMTGKCPSVTVVSNFNIPAYTGVWNEIYRYEHMNQFGGDCATATYTLVNDTVQVYNTMVLNGTRFTINGTAAPAPGADGSGKLLVNFPTADNNFSDYWVLATNYVDYAYVYACREIDDINKRVSSWILSRNKTLSPPAVLAIEEVIKKTSGLSWEVYRQTSQTETSCKYNASVPIFH